MKYILFVFICLNSHSLFAQINTDTIYGSWVKTKLTYKDGSELPDENILKATYVKYTFTPPDKMNISQGYWQDGPQFIFEILNNEIIIRTSVGSIINQIRILELNGHRMVLQQKGYQGFDDPASLKYTFSRETAFQNALPLNTSDIYAVVAGDTIYKECPKVYADYKGDGFQKYIYDNVGGKGGDGSGSSGHLAATFIVSKTGIADSLKILEGISPEFDKRFIKTFTKAKKNWKPAVLNGKYVPVQMSVDLNYGAFGPSVSAFEYTGQANSAFKQKDYQGALYFYDQALKNRPADRENLYNRGICKKMLGNLAGACEDWKKIKELGGNEADDLLAKYCH